MDKQGVRKITKDELLKNNGEDGNKLWILMAGKVYDVTDFSHPGGTEILMDEHGNDRFHEFDSLHSAAAKRQLSQLYLGDYLESEPGDNDNAKTNKSKGKTTTSIKNENSNSTLLIALAIFVIAFVVFKFVSKK